jgi:hypothetical protein
MSRVQASLFLSVRSLYTEAFLASPAARDRDMNKSCYIQKDRLVLRMTE